MAGTIGDAGLPRLRRLAVRLDGLTIPDVIEEFGVSKDCARRYVLRAIRYGILKRSGMRRRRTDIFGSGAPGGGGFVYRAVKHEGDRDPWEEWRSWQRRRK